ncbi:hypothetical protein Pan241w_31490 [Gimesia alba]|uniref:Glycosyltransferase RgtA/B/C/D-like domain-containing protein n=1 Tax=Gimesia alba TaxID=2527973 RepID=A0A517RGQ5_9PLAN|nr:hypothetical protein [Gimesia alba]QDT43052.1 hypothetical protein Pan241w_31490 [Gimesia alba]
MLESTPDNFTTDDLDNQKATLWLSGAALFLLSAVFFIIQAMHPPDWDAFQYMSIAQQFSETGMESYKKDVRTYFYPWVLSLIISLSKVTNLPTRILLFVFQTSFYFFCVNRLARAISIKNKKLGQIILVVLSVNIFVIPYLSLSLTEGIFLSLFILWLSAFTRLEKFVNKDHNPSDLKKEIILIAAASGIILVTRPAGLWICCTSFVMLLLKWKAIYSKFKPLQLTLLLVLAFFTFAAPLIPQFYLNAVNFQKASPFPVKDLAGFQIQVGIENLKYGTNISGGEPAIWYPNPFMTDNAASELGYRWYFYHPVKAFLTVLFKFIAAFDFEYLFCYVADLRPPYRWLTTLTSQTIFIIGLWRAITYCTKKDSFIGNYTMPLVCLFFWGLFTMPTALELRFSLPMQIIFLILTVQYLMEYRNYARRNKIKMVGIYLVSMLIIVPIAYYVSTLNVLLNQ